MRNNIYIVMKVIDIHDYYETEVPDFIVDIFSTMEEAKAYVIEKIQDASGIEVEDIKFIDGINNSICAVTNEEHDDIYMRWYFIVEQ